MSFLFYLLRPFLSLLYLLSVILVKIQPSLSTPEIISSCHLPFRCGNITASSPFWGGEQQPRCGHPYFRLLCDQNNATTMKIGDVNYLVLNIDPKEQVVRIARQDYFEGLCPKNNSTVEEELFDLSAEYNWLKLFYGCPMFPGQFTCYLKDITNNQNGFIQTTDNSVPGCFISVDFPVSKNLLLAARWSITALKEALEEGFEVKWKVNPCDENSPPCPETPETSDRPGND